MRKYWGFENFRPLQEDIVDTVINGHDTLALLPTGGGKSLCFQVPGLAREGITLVISPLIALMQDQVRNLRKHGIRAAELVSGMSYREIDILLDNARFGGLDFLYTSPERIGSTLFIERFKNMQVGLIVVDEAHCISEWGHDFRPAYLQISELREIHPEVPVIALTATATQQVREDICTQLELRQPVCFEAPFLRENLAYKVVQTDNKRDLIVRYLQKHATESGIIYCQTRKSVKDVTRHLLALGVKTGIYHGGMNRDERKLMLEAWMKNQTRIMVCTNAFGMGIDKPDVRFVLHYEFPDNLEAYFQEAGRAGRDREPAEAIAFYASTDTIDLLERVQQRFPEPEKVLQVYRALCNHLRIAIGSGTLETYHLSLKEFARLFRIDPLLCYNALKMLELNGDLTFSEGVFHPTRIRIAIGNKELYNFQIKYEQYAPFIQLVSRSYPGIFDHFFEIDEREVAKRLSKSEEEVKKILQALEKYGVLDINWQSALPSVTFQHERLPDDYLRLAPEVYLNRKAHALKRVEAVIEYLTEPKCRVVQLLNYFGQRAEKCGTCDVCLAEKRQQKLPSDSEVLEFLQTPANLEALQDRFNLNPQELKRILHKLLLEEKIKEHGGKFQRV